MEAEQDDDQGVTKDELNHLRYIRIVWMTTGKVETKPYKLVVLLLLAMLLFSACASTADGAESLPGQTVNEEEPERTDSMDLTFTPTEGIEVIYLAGGCFWGLEKLMQSLPGVVDAVSGYANGKADMIPSYAAVSTGLTGYRETVQVEYDPQVISLDAILFAYFHVIDPTIENQQGNDIGTQYQTGVYYPDEVSRATVERIAAIERARHEIFVVEIEALERFYDAEEYHQDYLIKNPSGYCHIPSDEISTISEMKVDPGNYPLPSQETIKANLTDLQYNVTQKGATEIAFMNEYWDNHEKGIYVDVVTGEPLFSSVDKFDSGTGWPSFTRPIDENVVRFIEDDAYNMVRTEVRSRAGNSHLGHVFYDDPVSPNGTRYCINSAALGFVRFEDLESEGYGYLIDIF